MRRRTVAIGLTVVVAAGVIAYGAVGLVGMQIASAEAGGCHAAQATFTPALVQDRRSGRRLRRVRHVLVRPEPVSHA
jgi:hypothetical protein